MKDPQNEYDFEEVCYDSNDGDFLHEFNEVDL